VASKLAALAEKEANWDRCLEILQPVADKLEDSDGARLLGMALSRRGDLQAALPLLRKFVESRLPALQIAETRLNERVARVNECILKDLEDGRAPKLFYQQYKRSNEVKQAEMVQKYCADRMLKESSISHLQDDLRKAAVVVPAALSLGTTLLQHAQQLADPAARNQALEEAEKTFVSIQSMAADSDEYRLYLGDVYYWLGKHEQGRQLFEDMLAAHNRDFQSLLTVGASLRSVGNTTEFRRIVEEAYETAEDEQQRHMAASFRAADPIDLDDQIKWFGLSDMTRVNVKAEYESAIAMKAATEGNDAKAKESFEKAINLYKSIPESTASLNNGALVLLNYARWFGDEAAFDEGLRRLEKALSLEPRDGILLQNIGELTLERALREIVRDSVDLAQLRDTIGIDILPSLHRTAGDWDRLRKQLTESRGVAQAIEYCQRVTMLAPKRTTAYGSLVSVYSYLEDVTALETISEKLASIELDTAGHTTQAIKFYQGDEQQKKLIHQHVDRLRETLERAREVGGVTEAIAIHEFVGGQLGLQLLRETIDLDGLVALANHSHDAHPSESTHYLLAAALLARGLDHAMGNKAELASFVDAYRVFLPSTHLVSLALDKDERLRTALLEHADIRQGIMLVSKALGEFPRSRSVWAWSLLRHADAAGAERLGQQLLESPDRWLAAQLEHRLSPASVTNAFELKWWFDLKGEPQQGEQCLRATRDAGIAIP
jgi:tetratricopeptide (TPR) repeat protein